MAKQFSESKRQRIMGKSGGRCWYCGVELFETKRYGPNDFPYEQEACIDHLVPKSRGGNNKETNLVPCCRSCNSSKNTLLLNEWRYRLCSALKPSYSTELRDYLLLFGIDLDSLPNLVATQDTDTYLFHFETLGLDYGERYE